MKKNISINICGTIYAIDEDAYQLLENYLQSMKNYFRNEEGGDEIADDIEHRVAELLWEYKEKGMTAVNIETIKEIINKVGNPADIDDGNQQTSQNATEGQVNENFFSSFGDETSLFGKMKKNVQSRRFYRNADNKMLGGICSGMAEYFGVGDVTFWRLGILILAIVCSGINVSLSFLPDILCFLISLPIPLIYLFIWIVVPEARTPEDRLRMQGRDINPENIREQVVSDSEGNKKVVETTRNGAAGCLKALLVCFLLLLMLPFFIAFFAILFAMFVVGEVIFGGASVAASLFPKLVWMFDPITSCGPMLWTGLIASLIVVCLSIFGLVRLFKSNRTSLPAWATVTMIITWLLALCVAIGSFVITSMKVSEWHDEIREKEATRNGICLFDSYQWRVMDELGWELTKLDNVNNYLSDNRTGYGNLPFQALKLRRNDSGNAMSFTLSRTEHFAEGDYVLESLTDVEGRGGSIKALDGSKKSRTPYRQGRRKASENSNELAVNDLNDKGQQLWTMDWTEGKELPIFENPDSAGWDAFAKDRYEHWTYRVSKPFHHKGGDITITIAADNAYLNKFNIRQVRLRKVDETKTVTKTEKEKSQQLHEDVSSRKIRVIRRPLHKDDVQHNKKLLDQINETRRKYRRS